MARSLRSRTDNMLIRSFNKDNIDILIKNEDPSKVIAAGKGGITTEILQTIPIKDVSVPNNITINYRDTLSQSYELKNKTDPKDIAYHQIDSIILNSTTTLHGISFLINQYMTHIDNPEVIIDGKHFNKDMVKGLLNIIYKFVCFYALQKIAMSPSTNQAQNPTKTRSRPQSAIVSSESNYNERFTTYYLFLEKLGSKVGRALGSVDTRRANIRNMLGLSSSASSATTEIDSLDYLKLNEFCNIYSAIRRHCENKEAVLLKKIAAYQLVKVYPQIGNIPEDMLLEEDESSVIQADANAQRTNQRRANQTLPGSSSAPSSTAPSSATPSSAAPSSAAQSSAQSSITKFKEAIKDRLKRNITRVRPSDEDMAESYIDETNEEVKKEYPLGDIVINNSESENTIIRDNIQIIDEVNKVISNVETIPNPTLINKSFEQAENATNTIKTSLSAGNLIGQAENATNTIKTSLSAGNLIGQAESAIISAISISKKSYNNAKTKTDNQILYNLYIKDYNEAINSIIEQIKLVAKK